MIVTKTVLLVASKIIRDKQGTPQKTPQNWSGVSSVAMAAIAVLSVDTVANTAVIVDAYINLPL